METKFKSIASILREMSASRGTEMRRKVDNVGRPNTAKDPMDPKSKLAKQGEIKTKIIDEAKDEDDDMKNKSKQDTSEKINKDAKNDNPKKNDAESSEDDPREIKGGVTQVELNPKTDDKIEGQESEDNKSKAARNKVNKEIGAKGSTMKESTQMFKSDGKYGSSDKLLEAVKEILEKKHTEPKSQKEKDLAALAHPKDKITHKDVLAGRGVIAKEEVEFSNDEIARIELIAKDLD